MKIKDFVQQNSQAEEQVRNIKEKYATELNEKEKVVHALSAAETQCRSLEEELTSLRSGSADWERKVSEMSTKMAGLEAEKEETNEKMEELTAEMKKNENEIERLQTQVIFHYKQNENIFENALHVTKFHSMLFMVT